jgi:hypothetical protein
MNNKQVALGGKTYAIVELSARKNAGWRKTFETQLGPLLNIVEQAGAGVELKSSDDLLRVANQIGRVLVQSPDILIGLLFSYAPNLESNREVILDTAYDSELIGAFTAVLGLAYPFGALARLASLASGSTVNASATTLPNSPSVNGVHSTTSSMSSGG